MMAFIRFSLFFHAPHDGNSGLADFIQPGVKALHGGDSPFSAGSPSPPALYCNRNGSFQLPSGSPVGTFPTPLFQIPEITVPGVSAPSPAPMLPVIQPFFSFKSDSHPFRLRTICRMDCMSRLAVLMSGQIADVGLDTFLLHLAGGRSHVDGRDLVNPLSGIGAQVKAVPGGHWLPE